jgi:phage terminase small subunit
VMILTLAREDEVAGMPYAELDDGVWRLPRTATRASAATTGYSPRTAEVRASRLLSDAKVQRATAAGMARRSKRTEVAADRVLLALARLGFSDIRRIFDGQGRLRRPQDWDDVTAAAISSVEVVMRYLGSGEVMHLHKIRLWSKNDALDKLAKHFGMYEEQRHPDDLEKRLFPDMTEDEIVDLLLEKRARRAKWLEAKREDGETPH